MRSHPAKYGVDRFGPPTLERSGSEHRRAVTSLALLERARAWEWVKDPPPGEGQVGHPQHCKAVTSFPFREGFLSPVRGTERVVKTIEGRFSKKPF